MTETLEDALARSEADVRQVIRLDKALSTALKKAEKAAKDGRLKDLPRALDQAREAVEALAGRLDEARSGWQFDARSYLGDGRYAAELLDAASGSGLKLYEQDQRLYCYPSLIRVVPDDPAVSIDRKKEPRLRPSVLVGLLKARQARPPRARPEAFLASLALAYRRLLPRGEAPGRVVELLEIYELLTLMPGARSEYSQPEFARDLYLLSRSGVTATADGLRVRLEASAGTRSRRLLRMIGEEGEERVYYGIAFDPA